MSDEPRIVQGGIGGITVEGLLHHMVGRDWRDERIAELEKLLAERDLQLAQKDEMIVGYETYGWGNP